MGSRSKEALQTRSQAFLSSTDRSSASGVAHAKPSWQVSTVCSHLTGSLGIVTSLSLRGWQGLGAGSVCYWLLSVRT